MDRKEKKWFDKYAMVLAIVFLAGGCLLGLGVYCLHLGRYDYGVAFCISGFANLAIVLGAYPRNYK